MNDFTIRCTHVETEEGPGPYGPRTKYVTSTCRAPATVLVVSESDDEQVSSYCMTASCADHADQDVHECSTWMSADQFTVVTL